MTILKSAFFKYLSALSLDERASFLWECGRASGEQYQELAELFNEHHPTKLAIQIEDYLDDTAKQSQT